SGADGGVAFAAGDGAAAGLAGAVVVAGGGAAARALDVGGELPGACADVGGGAAGWASGRGSDGRSASRLQATTTTSDAARAAPVGRASRRPASSKSINLTRPSSSTRTLHGRSAPWTRPML